MVIGRKAGNMIGRIEGRKGGRKTGQAVKVAGRQGRQGRWLEVRQEGWKTGRLADNRGVGRADRKGGWR